MAAAFSDTYRASDSQRVYTLDMTDLGEQFRLQAEQEKSSAALNSVATAVVLTLFKMIVGLLTNSLGILAEAVHSLLDLVAALVTFGAVRISSKPADREHLYGHGKFENISALFETLLLLATSVWIINESIQRILVKDVEVDASFWGFLVMGVSIVLDYHRSRLLYKTARKYNSQALEADALHFRTDIWSSAVVILGLIGLRIGAAYPGLAFLSNADAVAALGVALIVIFVSGELGFRTLRGLLDRAPEGLAEKVKRSAESVPGVFDCHAVRIRTSGPDLFIDIHINVDPHQSLLSAHQLTEEVEKAIRLIEPGADITVHPEPLESKKKPRVTENSAPEA
jgi:cation diffusion facilitator family transporter